MSAFYIDNPPEHRRQSFTYADLLDLMMADMAIAEPVYQPTNFWQVVFPWILKDLKDLGVQTFKRHPSAQNLYAPIYPNTPEGAAQALQEYTTFMEADRVDAPPFLTDVSESDAGDPPQRFTFADRRYSRPFLNYLRGLAFLKNQVDTRPIRSVLEIGGGFGSLAEILLKSPTPALFYVDVDIPPVAFIATRYLQAVFGKDTIADYEFTRDMDAIDIADFADRFRAMVLCPWQLPKLKGSFDLFVNFFSFQEMEPDVVANYARFINAHVTRYLLLRNQRDGKQSAKAAGHQGVLTPITRDDYLNLFKSFELVGIDSERFGNIPNGFPSEVMVLQRKK